MLVACSFQTSAGPSNIFCLQRGILWFSKSKNKEMCWGWLGGSGGEHPPKNCVSLVIVMGSKEGQMGLNMVPGCLHRTWGPFHQGKLPSHAHRLFQHGTAIVEHE